jgi:hypothetical protein
MGKTSLTNRIYQLQRMGLVQLNGNEVMPRCNLYRLGKKSTKKWTPYQES